MNTNELYIEYARVIEMCKGTKLEHTPYMGVKCAGVCSFHNHPRFSEHSDYYEFAIAVLEDRPVFVGDAIYYKCDGEKLEIVRAGRNGDIIIKELFNREVSIEFFSDDFTWTPPAKKRTFTLNGVDLPCPVRIADPSLEHVGKYSLRVAADLFYFDTMEDKDKVWTSLINLLTEAREK